MSATDDEGISAAVEDLAVDAYADRVAASMWGERDPALQGIAVSDLAAWLSQIWDEQEAAAKACEEVYPSPWEVSDRGWMAKVQADQPGFRVVAELEQQPSIDGWLSTRLDHLALHDPALVLARIAADRRILALHTGRPVDLDLKIRCTECSNQISYPCRTLRLLAQPYAARPGYDDGEWSA